MFVDNKEGWYALFVQANQEEKIKKILEREMEDKFKYIIPTRELKERKNGIWHTVRRKLFPGYVLIKGILSIEDYYKLKKIPDTIKLLRSENEVLKIKEEELQILNILIDDKDSNIGVSSLFKENEKIVIADGPLVGLEGLIISVNSRKGRAKVKLSFLNEERVVELGVNIIDKI